MAKFNDNNIKKYIEKTYNKSATTFHSLIKENLKNDVKTFVVTANPETLMIAEENEEFKNLLLDKETIIVPDGIGVVKGAKILNIQMEGTIPGVELCSKLFEYLNEMNKSLCLFGAKKEVVEKLNEVISEKYPNVNVVGVYDGYIEDKQSVMDGIKKLKPDVTLVALGIPNQELLIYNNLKDFEKGIFVGVGR